ncbi:MAG: hypothetical protein JJ863_13165 [Deltaproteobacteria bacterium]|nr:hypothetical protein [Deltaproteobacteria bacterium]
MARWLTVALGVGLAACTVGDIDLDDRPCPCIDGYRCVGGVCVEEVGADGGPDSGPDDGGPVDSGPDGGDRDSFVDGGGTDGFRDGGLLEGCEAEIGRRVLFCDDFESDLATSGWASDTEFGTTSRVDLGASGFGARMETTTSAGTAAIDHAIPARNSGALWARAWVRVPAPSFASPVRGRDALSIGSGSERSVRVIAGDDGRLALEVDGTLDEAASPAALETGVCVRLEVALASTSAGSATLYVGGTEVARVIDTPTLPASGDVDRVWSGIVEVDGPIALEVDDIAVDSAELDCP